MADTNDKVFDAMQSTASDKTFVDLFKVPEETTVETKEDKKTWKNFENALGDKFPKEQKSVLKKLWVEGGRPNINIMVGYDPVVEKSKYSTSVSAFLHRAHYSPHDWKGKELKKDSRDTINVNLANPVDNFIAEISHAFQWRRKPNEDLDTWRERRINLEKQWRKEKKEFGDLGMYGDSKLVPSKIQINPDTEVSMEKRKIFPISTAEDVIYDPETRLGIGGEKPTVEFEAHSIIEDSLWQDYQDRFGKQWGERGKGWRPYQKGWVKENKKYWDLQEIDLIKEGLLE